MIRKRNRAAEHAELRAGRAAARPPFAVMWLSAALMLLLAVLALFLFNSHRQAVQTATLTTSNLVRVIESGLSNDFERIEGLLGFVERELVAYQRRQELGEAAEEAHIRYVLQRLEGSFDKIAAVNVFDAEGRLRFSSRDVEGVVEIGDLAHFRYLRDDPTARVAFSALRVAGTTGRRSIAMGYAMRDDYGRFRGVAGAVMDIDAIGDVFRSIDVGEGGFALLRRSDDLTLLQRYPALNEADFNQPLPPDNPIRQRVEAGEPSGTLRYTASTDGIQRIGSFRVMERYPFYVQVAFAESHYLAGWWNQVRAVGVVALIVLAGFGYAIRRLRRDDRALLHIAHYDSLTGLPNRVLLADRLEQAMYRAGRNDRQIALAYLDLDGFKDVNDRHGHAIGDRLLSEIAQRMKGCLREGDTVARVGGDEFVVVLADVRTPAICMSLVRRLIAAIDRPAEVAGLDLHVTSSVGVTFYPQREPVEAEQLLRQADQAMYQAKLGGRNRFHVFDIEQHQLLRGQHEQLKRIERALKREEFVLHYQPKVNMRSGEVVGAEALLRWQHPGEGLLPPARFLPVIEQHPLDIEIGNWVIEAALRQAEKWRAEGAPLPVSVNVSAHFLQHPSFLERLESALARHPALPTGLLELEVLESSALSDVERASSVIEACAALGVRVALDDFGTGYSSLAYLKRLPAHVLKIDQGFVRDMLHDPDDLSILEGVLGLARAFGREVIAEGVETLEHGLLLLHVGCELAQGYGIARPMPGAEIARWRATWRPDVAWATAPTLDLAGLALRRAGVEQRAWVMRLQQWFEQGHGSVPETAMPACRCCDWIAQWRTGAEAGDVVALHRKMHELAGALVAHALAGEVERAGRCLGELKAQEMRFAAELARQFSRTPGVPHAFSGPG
ncbi:MAG: EAL domain-containing protein [Pseudazoarcus pumilus]|nr:EAL domain-containing protein [Pseudazoarcus pumilus]